MSVRKFLLLCSVLAFTACTTNVYRSPAPLDLTEVTYEDPDYDYESFSNSRVAILPFIYTNPSDTLMRKRLEDTLLTAIKGENHQLRIISQDSVRARINRNNIESDYNAVVMNYFRNNKINREELNKIFGAIGCDYLLLSRIFIDSSRVTASLLKKGPKIEVWQANAKAGNQDNKNWSKRRMINTALNGLAKRLGKPVLLADNPDKENDEYYTPQMAVLMVLFILFTAFAALFGLIALIFALLLGGHRLSN